MRYHELFEAAVKSPNVDAALREVLRSMQKNDPHLDASYFSVPHESEAEYWSVRVRDWGEWVGGKLTQPTEALMKKIVNNVWMNNTSLLIKWTIEPDHIIKISAKRATD